LTVIDRDPSHSVEYSAYGSDHCQLRILENRLTLSAWASPGVLALGAGKKDFLMEGTLTSHRLGCNTPNSFNPPEVRQYDRTSHTHTHTHTQHTHTYTTHIQMCVLKALTCTKDFTDTTEFNKYHSQIETTENCMMK